MGNRHLILVHLNQILKEDFGVRLKLIDLVFMLKETGVIVQMDVLELAVEAARVSSGGVQALEQQLPPATQLEEMPEHQEHQIMHQNN